MEKIRELSDADLDTVSGGELNAEGSRDRRFRLLLQKNGVSQDGLSHLPATPTSNVSS
jgi:hypothetical protein